jgi:UDP-2,4-diacetamido-2,4,6-trideoxy-beta-L-altropyranose hydrolase
MNAGPQWLFQVDMDPTVGGGHIARCRALGRELQRTAPVAFVMEESGAHWEPTLKTDGFQVVRNSDLPKRRWCGSLMDGYRFTKTDTERLAKLAPPLTVMDDLLGLPLAADMIVCPGAAPDTPLARQVEALLGPRYALLRPEFAGIPDRPAPRIVNRVLLSFGFTDSRNGTGLALSALQQAAKDGFEPQITVALGSAAPHLDAVRRQIAELDERATLIVDAEDMDKLLTVADLVIGAGGVSLFERMAAGAPSITVTIADNQIAQAKFAADAEATAYAGHIDGTDVAAMASLIRNLAADPGRRQSMAKAGRKLVDGRGAARVAAAMNELTAIRTGKVTCTT